MQAIIKEKKLCNKIEHNQISTIEENSIAKKFKELIFAQTEMASEK